MSLTKPGRTMMNSIGDAAEKTVGTGAGNLPTNGDLPTFGTAAVVDTGTGASEVPTNDDITAAYLKSALGYASAESGELAIPAAGASVAFAHGLGSRPDNVEVVLRCTTDDSPFTAGEEVPITSHMPIDGASEFGLMVVRNATHVTVVRGANALNIYNSGDGNAFALDTADWRIVIHARILP